MNRARRDNTWSPRARLRRPLAWILFAPLFATFGLVAMAVIVVQSISIHRDARQALLAELGALHDRLAHALEPATTSTAFDRKLHVQAQAMLREPLVDGVAVFSNSEELITHYGIIDADVVAKSDLENRDSIASALNMLTIERSVGDRTIAMYSCPIHLHLRVAKSAGILIAIEVATSVLMWIVFFARARRVISQPIMMLTSAVEHNDVGEENEALDSSVPACTELEDLLLALRARPPHAADDQHERLEAELRLHQLEAKLSAFAHNSPSPIFSVTIDGEIDWRNIPGKALLDALDIYPMQLRRWLVSARDAYTENRTIHRQSEFDDHHYDAWFVPEIEYEMTCVYVYDTTVRAQMEAKLRKLERALQNSNAAATAANRAKGEFLVNMSHELRTPISAILGFTDVLLEANLSDVERRESAEIVQRSARLVLSIIDDMLDLSSIESGQLSIEMAQCSAVDVLEESKGLINAVGASDVHLAVHYGTPMPTKIRTDGARLRQIVMDLTRSVAALLDAQRLTIRASIVTDPQHLLELTIAPDGGLTSDQGKQLLRALSFGSSAIARSGIGLGLLLVRRLAQALDGDVLLDTGTEIDTRLRVRIATGSLDAIEWIEDPQSARDASGAREGAIAGEQTRLAGRVLLADDDERERKRIGSLLRAAGLDVDFAGDGRLAIASAFGACRYDAILMDMNMPDLDGFSATSEIRRRGFDGTIIALTAHTMISDRRLCREAGCDDSVDKPVQERALLRTLSLYLESQSAVAES